MCTPRKGRRAGHGHRMHMGAPRDDHDAGEAAPSLLRTFLVDAHLATAAARVVYTSPGSFPTPLRAQPRASGSIAARVAGAGRRAQGAGPRVWLPRARSAHTGAVLLKVPAVQPRAFRQPAGLSSLSFPRPMHVAVVLPRAVGRPRSCAPHSSMVCGRYISTPRRNLGTMQLHAWCQACPCCCILPLLLPPLSSGLSGAVPAQHPSRPSALVGRRPARGPVP